MWSVEICLLKIGSIYLIILLLAVTNRTTNITYDSEIILGREICM